MRYVALEHGKKPKYKSSLKKYSSYLVEDGLIGAFMEDYGPGITKYLTFRTVMSGTGEIALLDELTTFMNLNFFNDERPSYDDAPWGVSVEIFCPSKDLVVRCAVQYYKQEDNTHEVKDLIWFDRVNGSDTTTFVNITTPVVSDPTSTIMAFPSGHDFNVPENLNKFVKDYGTFTKALYDRIPGFKDFVLRGVNHKKISDLGAIEYTYLCLEESGLKEGAEDKKTDCIIAWNAAKEELGLTVREKMEIAKSFPTLDLLFATFLYPIL